MRSLTPYDETIQVVIHCILCLVADCLFVIVGNHTTHCDVLDNSWIVSILGRSQLVPYRHQFRKFVDDVEVLGAAFVLPPHSFIWLAGVCLIKVFRFLIAPAVKWKSYIHLGWFATPFDPILDTTFR